jgi:hypothetical protein
MLKRFFINNAKKQRYVTAAIFAIGITLIGSILIIDSHASTPYAIVNADKGVLAGGAELQNDSLASDGKSVMFGGVNPAHQAVSAYSFVNSIGVATHLYDLNLPDGNTQAMINALTTAGIKHIRDGYSVPITLPWATYLSDETSIFQEVQAAGIDIDLGITGCPNDGTTASPSVWASTVAANLNPAKIDYVELTNEIDNFCGTNWLTGANSFMQAFSFAVRANPKLSTIPIIGPSFVNSSSVTNLGNLTPYINYGNIHPYMNGNTPQSSYITTSQYPFIAPDSGSDPVIATEVGNQTANLALNDGAYEPVPDSVQAIYAVNTYLEHYIAGVKSTYEYELVDDANDSSTNNMTPEDHFGLLNYDFSPKPAYTAIKNLISLLSDSSSFTTGSLNYTITGGNSTTHSLLMEKQNGSYWLAIWQDDSVYDRDTRTDIALSQVPVTINFNKPMSSIKTYDPIESTSPVSTVTVTGRYSLTSTPNVTLVNISP